MSGSVFQRIEALERLGCGFARLLESGLETRLERAERIIEAQADLIRVLTLRLGDDDLSGAAQAVLIAGDLAGPFGCAPVDLRQVRRMLAVVAPVLTEHRVDLEVLRGPSRASAVVRCRWAAMSALRDAGFTVVAVGQFLRRDPSTVTHGLQRGAK